jgi:hypothetical protein
MLSNVGRFRIPRPSPPAECPRAVCVCVKRAPHYGALFRVPVRNQTPQIIYLSELVYTDVVTGSFQLAGSALPPLESLRDAGDASKTAADRLLGLDAGDWSILVLGAALTGLLVVLF